MHKTRNDSQCNLSIGAKELHVLRWLFLLAANQKKALNFTQNLDFGKQVNGASVLSTNTNARSISVTY
ncbi:hypothetical protein BFJ69_g14236 [Fusarium oxysporum]|uniref:Uncharacterized protein n=1 Tax=Fusarium oxysporum TaxID=5507 RepID=A0A420MIE1_FUSOX|nr:hypothetical protein BFJ69_g14236 [Fusarium oxysporum]